MEKTKCFAGDFIDNQRSLKFVSKTLVLQFSLLMCPKIINYGPDKKFVKPLFIFWIIFLLDLELKFIDKL